MSFFLRGVLGFAVFALGCFFVIIAYSKCFDWLKWNHKPSEEEINQLKILNQKMIELNNSHRTSELAIIEKEIKALQQNGPNDPRWNRLTTALFYFSVGVAITFLFGLMIGITTQNYAISFKFSFWFLGAIFILGAILELLNAFNETNGKGNRLIYAVIIYYGTGLVKQFVSEFVHGTEYALYFFSAVFTLLICVIVWLIRKRK